jgi:Lrp/AsnC family leucine-responsive transcriptional regulator
MPSQNIDQTDKKIVAELARDSSQSTKKLAEKIGVTRQTIASRIARLERLEIVNGSRAKLDYSKLGYNNFFVLFLKIGFFDQGLLEKALEDFRSSHNVLMDTSVTGEWDIMQVLAFKDTQEYDKYIANLRTKYGRIFRDSKSHAILKFFKSTDEFIPSP